MKVPFRCPVCGGSGKVPHGFYDQINQSTTDITPETCRSCKGSGIVYVEQSDKFDYDVPLSGDHSISVYFAEDEIMD